jgi:hypothetical protein
MVVRAPYMTSRRFFAQSSRRRTAAGLLARDEARRIGNMDKMPELLKRPQY